MGYGGDAAAALRRFDFAALYNTFLSLPSKQQTITLAVAVVVVLMLTIVPLIFVMSHLSGLEETIAETRERIDTAVDDIHAFREVEAQVQAVEKLFNKQSGDSLLTVVQRVAEDHELRAQNIAGRGEESFDVYEEERARFHIKDVELPQLVRFMHTLESTPQRIIRIKKVKITPVYGNRGLLNADFSEVAAYKLVSEGR